MAAARHSRYYTYIKPVVENRFAKSAAPFIFSLISISVFAVFAIRPTITTILSLQQEINSNQKILDQLNQKARNLSEGRQNYQKIPSDVQTKIRAYVPDSPQVPLFINNLQNAAANQGSASALQIQPLTLIDLTNQNPANLQLDEIDFSYNAQGSFTQLLTIVDNIQKLSRLTRVDNVTLTKQGDGPLTLTLTGKAYFIK
ncbi:type 4a pilus biogenesis protein PilO [Patescibacteria group bacterium]|nr:type 4a pilus biogenesis protein PilO [Patescibacteria group bacterium]